jgi:hypothetical protein
MPLHQQSGGKRRVITDGFGTDAVIGGKNNQTIAVSRKLCNTLLNESETPPCIAGIWDVSSNEICTSFNIIV